MILSALAEGNRLTSNILNLLPGFFLNKTAEFLDAAASQVGFFYGQGVVLPHDKNEVIPRFCRGKDLIILPLGFRRSGFYKVMVRLT